MNESEFLHQQQAAIERMRELNAKSQIPNNTRHKMPPVPSFVKMPENNYSNKRAEEPPTAKDEPINYSKPQINKPVNNQGLNIPLLNDIIKDGDSALILGLLLILISENADKMLLFALVYILL